MGKKRKAQGGPGFAEEREALLRAFDPCDRVRYLVLSDLYREHGLDREADRLAKAGQSVGTRGKPMLSVKCERTPAGVSFHPDGVRLACATQARGVTVWDTVTGEESSCRGNCGGPETKVRFSPDGTRLAAGGCSGVEVWDAATGALVLEAATDWGLGGDVCFSPDGRRLAGGGGDGVVSVWDLSTGQELLRAETHTPQMREVQSHAADVRTVCFSPDGARLALAAGEEPLEVRDSATGEVVWRADGRDRGSLSVAFAPDGRFATADWDGRVKVYDASGGGALVDLDMGGGMWALRFSPDGRLLAGAGGDLLVWDAATGAEVFAGKDRSEVGCVDFSPDGRRLAYGTNNDRLKVVWLC